MHAEGSAEDPTEEELPCLCFSVMVICLFCCCKRLTVGAGVLVALNI